MTTINIFLPEDLQIFIQEQAAQGGYQTTDDYIQDLLRREQQKQIESILIESLDSGELIEVTEEWWEEKQSELTQHLS